MPASTHSSTEENQKDHETHEAKDGNQSDNPRLNLTISEESLTTANVNDGGHFLVDSQPLPTGPQWPHSEISIVCMYNSILYFNDAVYYQGLII